jgi:hypothetical protein
MRGWRIALSWDHHERSIGLINAYNEIIVIRRNKRELEVGCLDMAACYVGERQNPHTACRSHPSSLIDKLAAKILVFGLVARASTRPI